MRKRNKFHHSEINLTPLLDVLFSILFIIMLTSRQNEDSLNRQVQEQTNQIEQMEQQLIVRENQLNSYDLYHTEAIIITLSNFKDKQIHKLIISEGLEKKEIETITLGSHKIENTNNRLEKCILNIIQKTDNQPIYIVFHCDKSCIYTDEYNAISMKLEKLQTDNKEIFYKITEGE